MDNNGYINCTLLIGKAHVTPQKYVSMPRMELTAATLSVKTSKLLTKELTGYKLFQTMLKKLLVLIAKWNWCTLGMI